MYVQFSGAVVCGDNMTSCVLLKPNGMERQYSSRSVDPVRWTTDGL